MTWDEMLVKDDIRAINGARCINPTASDNLLGPDAWTPDGKTDMEPGRIGWIAARECRMCPARLECLTQAVARDEQHSIWGGFWFGDPADKKAAVKALRLKKKAA